MRSFRPTSTSARTTPVETRSSLVPPVPPPSLVAVLNWLASGSGPARSSNVNDAGFWLVVECQTGHTSGTNR